MTKTRADLKMRGDKPSARRTSAKNKSAPKKIKKKIPDKKGAGLLDSKTRACLDNGDPILRRNPKGELETEPSQEAMAAAKGPLRAVRRGARPVKKKPEEVEADAEALVLSEGGDPRNERLVRSRFIIQFGKYRGKPFKWLLENDLGWTIYLVGSHLNDLNDLDEGKKRDGPLVANKDSFAAYANACPEVGREIESWRSRQKVGDAPLDFGRHRSETPRSLYESTDPEKIGFVAYLRGMSRKCTSGSKMETAIKYILHRDKERASASTRAPSLKRKRKTTAKSSKRGSRGNEHFVDKHRLELIERVGNVSPILDVLLQERVVTQEGYNKIRALPTTEKRMREIYRVPLQGGPACKDIFYESLVKNESFLIDYLKKKK